MGAGGVGGAGLEQEAATGTADVEAVPPLEADGADPPRSQRTACAPIRSRKTNRSRGSEGGRVPRTRRRRHPRRLPEAGAARNSGSTTSSPRAARFGRTTSTARPKIEKGTLSLASTGAGYAVREARSVRGMDRGGRCRVRSRGPGPEGEAGGGVRGEGGGGGARPPAPHTRALPQGRPLGGDAASEDHRHDLAVTHEAAAEAVTRVVAAAATLTPAAPGALAETPT